MYFPSLTTCYLRKSILIGHSQFLIGHSIRRTVLFFQTALVRFFLSQIYCSPNFTVMSERAILKAIFTC